MNKSRIWWGQIALLVLTAVLSVWIGVQWIAHQLDYDPYLGQGIADLFGWRIYAPWMLADWVYHYYAYQPHIFDTALIGISVSSITVTITIAVTLSVRRASDKEAPNTYGSARWATPADVHGSGLMGNEGVYLGAFDVKAQPFTQLPMKGDQWPVPPGLPTLRHDGPEHVLGFAPTRSGKGVGLVLPTLLTWRGSVIVHDLKRENWDLTAGYRSKFSHVLLFDPTNPASARFNPLLEVRMGDSEVRDVQNIADILVDPDGGLEKRDHWQKTAHSLLTGAIMHVLYAEADKSLHGVAAFLTTPGRTFPQTLHLMMGTKHLGDRPHPIVAQCAREMLDKAPNELSGCLSTALSFLSLYRDPIVARVTSSSDFRLVDLTHAPHPVSLYLAVPPSDQSRTKPLIRLVLNQVSRRLTEELADGRRHKVLMMLDEFPALGRLDFFETALAFFAGYGVRCYLIAQSLNQIEKAYGPNNSILDNCHVRITYATNDERTAKRISEALGQKTEMKTQRNFAGHRFAGYLSHSMVMSTETQRALATPGEIMQMPQTDAIVMVSGQPPVYARKVRYYLDGAMVARSKLPPPQLVPGKPYPDRPDSQRDDWSGLKPLNQDASVGTGTGAAGTSAGNDGPDDGRKPELPNLPAPKEPQPSPPDHQHARDQVERDDEHSAAIAAAARQQQAQEQTLSRARGLELGREEGGLPL